MDNSESEISRYFDCSDSFAEQKSAMTDYIGIQKQVKRDQSDSEDINQQNIHNKRSEKLSKPCRDGFCYCFTSDSDQHVNKKKLRTKSRKYCLQSSQSSKCSEENTTETSDFPEIYKTELSENTSSDQVSSKRKYKHQYINRSNNYELQAKAILDKNVNGPLIHIVQEIYRDKVISEVKVNETLFNAKKILKNSDNKKKLKTEYMRGKTLEEINGNFETECGKLHTNAVRNHNLEENLNEIPKEKNYRAERLLKRRVSENFQNISTYCKAPPKKPPRRFSENVNHLTKTSKIITDFEEAEIVLSSFLSQYGQNFESDENVVGYKPMPSFDITTKKDHNDRLPKIVPSCPLYESESETESGIESNIEETKINDLQFNSKPSVQMGWVVPPKQDIDTVDCSIKPSREVDNFHNFAENMESKSTPVKSAQFVDINQSEINNKAYETPKKMDLSSSSTVKVKERTCDFFKNSANKFVNLVYRKNNKEKFRNKLYQKDVSCQTSNLSLHDKFLNATNDNKKGQSSLHQHNTNLSNHPKKIRNSEDFDFNRKINSPKNERNSQRRLSFSPKKIMKNFSQRSSNNILQNRNNFEFYKSYQADYNEDFSLNLMNDILLSIKAKLEASDRHATKVFEEVERNEKFRNLHFAGINESENKEEGSGNSHGKITLENAEVHNCYVRSDDRNYLNDIYSEIEEEKVVFSGSPSVRSLDEISHFYVNNDPNSEYAEVKKTKSKSRKSSQEEKNYPGFSTETNKLTYADIEIKPGYESYDEVSDSLCKMTLEQDKNIASERENKLVEAEYISQKLATEPVQKIYCPGSSSNLSRNAIKSVRISESCIEENQTRPVKELVDYFEHSLCYNDQFNSVQDASYESPNDSTNFENKTSNALQELHPVSYTPENIYYEILDKKERSESCPIAENNAKRQFSIGKYNSFTCASFDYSLNNSFQVKKSAKYGILKRKFRKSISKGKSLFKNKFQNYSPNDMLNTVNSYDPWEQSNLGITKLFAEDDDECWRKQLEKAVFICRKIPLLQNTLEAVEAERLLLYSALKIEKLKTIVSDKNDSVIEKLSTKNESWICIKEFELPIQSDIEFIDFFNFFYVGVFSDGNKIISTNYAEKHDKLIIFRNCNINFENINCNTKIICDIYVLRLRKVLSTKITKEQVKAKMEEINGFSDSDEQLLSRFKFQGSFQFFPHNFTPLKINNSGDEELKNSNKFCLRSLKSINLSTEIDGEHSLILNYINITVELEIFFKKFMFEGFLNVRSITSEHDWNKRWCKINNFNLLYWDYPQDCNDKPPIFICNLVECVNEKIEVASQELCPRPKSFIIKLKNNLNLRTDIYFSADNQNDLNYWLNGLNNILSFKKTWM